MNNDNNNDDNNNVTIILTTYAIISVLIVTIITTFSAVLTQAIEQAQVQSLSFRAKAYVIDVNVHFKTALYLL